MDSLEDLELNKRNIALFTDSLSALQGLDSDRDDLTLLKIKQSLSKLGEERNTLLQWIPAHCGIPGNEEADKLAKIGSEANDDQPSSLTYAEVKTIVKTKWNNDREKNHSYYSMEKDAMHSEEREQQKTIFRLLAGHGCLRAHLHKQGKTDSPYCNCGPVAQTPHHVLQDCPLLDGLQEEIWLTPTSLETKHWDSGREELQKTTTPLKRAGINTKLYDDMTMDR